MNCLLQCHLKNVRLKKNKILNKTWKKQKCAFFINKPQNFDKMLLTFYTFINNNFSILSWQVWVDCSISTTCFDHSLPLAIFFLGVIINE